MRMSVCLCCGLLVLTLHSATNHMISSDYSIGTVGSRILYAVGMHMRIRHSNAVITRLHSVQCAVGTEARETIVHVWVSSLSCQGGSNTATDT